MSSSMMDIEERRAYVKQIRDSFEEANGKTDRGEYAEVQDFGKNRFFYVKLRFFIAVMLFLAFVLCDVTKSEFYGISTEQIVSEIKANYNYTNVEKYVMMFAQEIQKL